MLAAPLLLEELELDELVDNAAPELLEELAPLLVAAELDVEIVPVDVLVELTLRELDEFVREALDAPLVVAPDPAEVEALEPPRVTVELVFEMPPVGELVEAPLPPLPPLEPGEPEHAAADTSKSVGPAPKIG